MSKLDRYLVTSNFFSIWKDPLAQVLHRTISDHCSIILKLDFNYGPKHLRVFDSWLDNKDFKTVVDSCWTSNSFVQGAAGFVLKEKLKALKKSLRGWSKKDFENRMKRKVDITKALLN